MASARRGRAALGLLVVGVLLQACASGPPPTATDLGEQALERGDWRSARNQFTIALRSDPRNGRAWLGQARAELAGRDPEAALGSLGNLARVDRARWLDPDQGKPVYADALEAATRRRIGRKQTEAALAAVRGLAQIDPDRRGLDRLLGDALLAEGDRLRLLGQRAPAYALFEEACRVVPHRLEAWLGAAEILIETRKGPGAVRLLEAARRHHPTAGEIRLLTLRAMGLR